MLYKSLYVNNLFKHGMKKHNYKKKLLSIKLIKKTRISINILLALLFLQIILLC